MNGTAGRVGVVVAQVVAHVDGVVDMAHKHATDATARATHHASSVTVRGRILLLLITNAAANTDYSETVDPKNLLAPHLSSQKASDGCGIFLLHNHF